MYLRLNSAAISVESWKVVRPRALIGPIKGSETEPLASTLKVRERFSCPNTMTRTRSPLSRRYIP